MQWQDPTTKCVGKEKLVERQIGFFAETTLYLQQPGEKLKKAKKCSVMRVSLILKMIHLYFTPT